MTNIIDDFKPYIDGNGLLAPNPVPAEQQRGSDNQPLFTSEYTIIVCRALSKRKCSEFYLMLKSCTNSDNYLVRAPGDDSLGNPDNHYGVYAACVELGVKPTFKFYWKLLRQPQLLFAHYCAKEFDSVLACLLYFPLSIITAIIIATSCIGVEVGNTDARRLSWLLIQATRPKSVICRLASKLWYKRLHRDYAEGMKTVNSVYFQPHGLDANPYSKWVIE